MVRNRNVLLSANPVNGEDTRATTTRPRRIRRDRGRGQAGPNGTVSGAPTPRPLVTSRDEVGRLRAAARGRERADSDGRQHPRLR
jgi:hypothetical protein